MMVPVQENQGLLVNDNEKGIQKLTVRRVRRNKV